MRFNRSTDPIISLLFHRLLVPQMNANRGQPSLTSHLYSETSLVLTGWPTDSFQSASIASLMFLSWLARFQVTVGGGCLSSQTASLEWFHLDNLTKRDSSPSWCSSVGHQRWCLEDQSVCNLQWAWTDLRRPQRATQCICQVPLIISYWLYMCLFLLIRVK